MLLTLFSCFRSVHWRSLGTASETGAFQANFQDEKSYSVVELAQFFVTGPTDAANKLSQFYCRLCQKDVSVLTHGMYENRRHFQGHRRFARDQRLRLETPGWRVLDCEGNPLPEREFERQRKKIMLAPLVVRDREYPFREDLIQNASGNVDPHLPMMAKVLCSIDALQLSGSYKVILKLWELLVLTASWINVTVAWFLDEVLVSSVFFPDFRVKFLIYIQNVFNFLVLVHYSERDASSRFGACRWLGMGISAIQCGVQISRLFHLGFCQSVEDDRIC